MNKKISLKNRVKINNSSKKIINKLWTINQTVSIINHKKSMKINFNMAFKIKQIGKNQIISISLKVFIMHKTNKIKNLTIKSRMILSKKLMKI